MKINKNNYEEYLMDYMDGNLSSELCAEIELFLENNPEIRAELEGIDDIVLYSDESIFENQQSLLKDLSNCDENTIDELFAKKLEGDLSEEESKMLDELLVQNPDRIASWNLISKTKLVAEKIEFKHKAILHANAPIDYSIKSNLIIGKLEGDLDNEQFKAYSSLYKSDKNIQEEEALFAKLKLSAQSNVIYADKAGLKKKPVLILWPRFVAAIAAAILVLITFRFYFNSDSARIARQIQHDVEVRDVHSQGIAIPDLSESKELAISHESDIEDSGITNSDVDNTPDLPSMNKMSIACTNPLASLNLEKNLVITPLENTIEIEDNLLALENTPTNKVEFPTVIGMLEDKVKKQLWGDTEYPEENYLLALSGKTVEKLSKNAETDVEVDVTDVKKGGFYLKIGRFSIERNR